MARGRFITVEGGEGAGKSTQAALLTQALAARGLDVVQTREPGGAPGAERIRSLLLAPASPPWSALSEALLHFAARSEHLVFTIRPALKSGRWVVCDRFVDSTVAYQGYAQGLERGIIERLSRLVVGDDMPDLPLILDIAAEPGLARLKTRGAPNRYDEMDLAFHERLREGFLEIARAAPERCVVSDAEAPIEVLHRAILDAVIERLEVPGGA